MFRIRFSRNFNFSDETGYGNDLTDEQIDDLKVSTRDILGEEFQEATVAISTDNCTKILDMTGRRLNNAHEESRMRAIL